MRKWLFPYQSLGPLGNTGRVIPAIRIMTGYGRAAKAGGALPLFVVLTLLTVVAASAILGRFRSFLTAPARRPPPDERKPRELLAYDAHGAADIPLQRKPLVGCIVQAILSDLITSGWFRT
jgi:hypothetical protein